MKTSNKLLLTAALIVIISMVAYDLALRAEYVKGDYKNRFYGMVNLGFKTFKIIDNRAANYLNINVERGDHFGVWINKDFKSLVKISQTNGQLIIDVADRNNPKITPYNNNITIICPELDQITDQAVSAIKEDKEIFPPGATTTLTGFDQQNMNLIIMDATHLNLEKSKIENLNAMVGNSTSRYAYLGIAGNNQIKNATIQVPGKNQLNVDNPKIMKANFVISDSAVVNLGGSMLKQLRQQP